MSSVMEIAKRDKVYTCVVKVDDDPIFAMHFDADKAGKHAKKEVELSFVLENEGESTYNKDGKQTCAGALAGAIPTALHAVLEALIHCGCLTNEELLGLTDHYTKSSSIMQESILLEAMQRAANGKMENGAKHE